eukprot:1636041-Rhodomonas_salina.1
MVGGLHSRGRQQRLVVHQRAHSACISSMIVWGHPLFVGGRALQQCALRSLRVVVVLILHRAENKEARGLRSESLLYICQRPWRAPAWDQER